MSFPSRPTPRLIAATLLETLTGHPTRLDRFAIIRRLVELLTEAPAIVVVDESHLLTSDCIELLRYLHDHRTTRFALVLVGGNGTWRMFSREPMLASRDRLWKLVDLHLHAERVCDLVLLRAHTLT